MKTFSSYSDETSKSEFRAKIAIKTNETVITGYFNITDYDKLSALSQAKKITETFRDPVDVLEITDVIDDNSYDKIPLNTIVDYYDFSDDDKQAINKAIVKRKHNNLGEYLELEILDAAPNSIRKDGEIDIVNYDLIIK